MALKLAGIVGLEPTQKESKSFVLPLDYIPKYINRIIFIFLSIFNLSVRCKEFVRDIIGILWSIESRVMFFK